MKRRLSETKEETSGPAPPEAAPSTCCAGISTADPSVEEVANVFGALANELVLVNVRLDARFLRFVQSICASYGSEVPYHNWRHAVDVLRTTSLLSFQLRIGLQTMERLALFTAALVHDAGHVGRSNDVLEQERHPLALRYNNVSILEQQSCTLCFEALARDECAFTSGLSQPDAKLFRNLVLKLVLSTDIAGQDRKQLVQQAFERLQPDTFDESQRQDRDALLILLLRCADIGTVIKSETEFMEWSRLLYHENNRVVPCEPSLYLERQDKFLRLHALPEYQLLLPFLTKETADEIEIRLNELCTSLQQIDLPKFTEFLHSDQPWVASHAVKRLSSESSQHHQNNQQQLP